MARGRVIFTSYVSGTTCVLRNLDNGWSTAIAAAVRRAIAAMPNSNRRGSSTFLLGPSLVLVSCIYGDWFLDTLAVIGYYRRGTTGPLGFTRNSQLLDKLRKELVICHACFNAALSFNKAMKIKFRCGLLPHHIMYLCDCVLDPRGGEVDGNGEAEPNVPLVLNELFGEFHHLVLPRSRLEEPNCKMSIEDLLV